MSNKIDLSQCELKEIEYITEKPIILILDKNKITKIDKLTSQIQLQQLSISHNQIIQLNGLSSLINLTVLNLSHNNIISIDGLKTLSRLTWLNLSNNRLKSIEHLEGNLQLKHLDLSDNYIVKLSKISYLKKLKTFLLHGNDVSDLNNFGLLLPKTIEILSLAENRIHDLTEIYYLASLTNLKQLSLKENPCLMKESKDMKFDYRPYIVNWCLNLNILDGEEINEKEKLIAEWLYTQGKGRYFKPGHHFDLVYYLTNECALTNLKNKSKLINDLDTILKQRKQHSSRRNYVYNTSQKIFAEDANHGRLSRADDTSCDIDEADLNQSFSTQSDDNIGTNTSMLMSESSFLPISPSNPIVSSPSNQDTLSPNQRTLSPNPTDNSQCSDYSTVPMLRYSREPPIVSRKTSNKSALNSSIDGCSIFHTSFVNDQDDQINDQNVSKFTEPQANNSAHHNSNVTDIPIAYVIRLQAWWRGIYVRSKNPIVKKYLINRESQRTRSHILFLQRQMQLYYESYEQQRKLNATQSEAITFLIDQIREISQWKENLNSSQIHPVLSTKAIQQDQFTQSHMEVDANDKQFLLNKVEDLQDQIFTLKETVWKLEHTIQRTLQITCHEKVSEENDEPSEISFSEESDLNKLICEAEKILDPEFRDSLSCTLSDSMVLMPKEDKSSEIMTSINDTIEGNK